ncbi:MAG TPA: hypothetical protein PKD91_12810 [Bacteroidia bacterium]|nr:hypothetical protein [Bacteroidia bacterium]
MNEEAKESELEETEVFIPMLPSQRMRFGLMLSTALPGVILMMSAISSKHDTLPLLAIKFFSCLAAFMVIFTSIREFKKPGSYKWMGADTITVFTGFMIIALGANMYNAFKGFQPAHGYFLAGFITIFKGVMVPEKKIKRGFTVTESEVRFNRSFLSGTKKIPVEGISKIELIGHEIVFKYSNNSEHRISVSKAANGSQMADSLRQLLMD